MITLDASVVIAHLSPRDAHHRVVSDYLRTTSDEFVMHSVNLAEVLVGGVRAGRGQEMLDDLSAMGVSVAAPPEGESLRLAGLRVRWGLKLPDCCALDTALVTGSTLATVDADLARVAHECRLAVGPARRPQ